MDAEVPYAQVDLFIRDYFHQGVFAEREGLARRKLHPVPAGENLGGSLNYILLLPHTAQHVDPETGNNARSGPNVSPDNDIAAFGRAAGGYGVRSGTGTVGIDGKRRAACIGSDRIAQPKVN